MRAFAVGVAVAAGACGDAGGSGSADTGAGTDASAATDASAEVDTGDPGACVTPGDDGPRFDQTSSRLMAGIYPTFRSLGGQVLDGAPPAPHLEAERRGQCRLLRYTPSFCDPACELGRPCIDGACVAWPEAISAGTLTVTGIAPEPVTVEPSAGVYFWQAEDPFVTSSIAVAAAGDVVPAFALAACAPTPFEPDGDWSAQMEARADGADVTLRWTDPTPGARIYLRMTTGIGTHGGISPVEIECEGKDSGSLTLPGAYLDALYAEGWSCGECGGNDLVRYFAAETTAGDETVELRVETRGSFWFRP